MRKTEKEKLFKELCEKGKACDEYPLDLHKSKEEWDKELLATKEFNELFDKISNIDLLDEFVDWQISTGNRMWKEREIA